MLVLQVEGMKAHDTYIALTMAQRRVDEAVQTALDGLLDGDDQITKEDEAAIKGACRDFLMLAEEALKQLDAPLAKRITELSWRRRQHRALER